VAIGIGLWLLNSFFFGFRLWSILFWIGTGKYVGGNIANRCHELVPLERGS
jgi:hypothetical protein